MTKVFAKIFLTVIIFFNFVGLGECSEFVFVINSSQSMNESDPLHRVNEAVTWAVENISDDDEIGIITFNDSPQVIQQLSKNITQKKFSFDYSGQSNSGAAVLTAVDMLTPKFHTERHIIVISNGESSSMQSTKNFQAALEQAKWSNISVHILNLRYFGDAENYHSFSTYAKEIPIPHNELMTTMRTIFHNDFHMPSLNLYSENLTEQKLSLQNPIPSANKARIFLISSNPGSATLKDSGQVTGQFVEVFDVNPNAKELEFDLNYPQGTALTIDAVFEVDGELQANFNFDTLDIAVLDDDYENILDNKNFDGKNIRVKINGEIQNAKISEGKIQIPLKITNRNISLQKIYFEDIGIIFKGNDTDEFLAPEYNYFPYFLAFLAIVAILILAFRRKMLSERPTDTPAPPTKILPKLKPTLEEEKPAQKQISKKTITKADGTTKIEVEEVENEFSYKGKLSIYVTKTATGEEFEPRDFNLFRLHSKTINLLEVLQDCKIEEKFMDIENIIITPTKRGILISNNSNCTILKRGNIVANGKQTEIFYGDSINIATENGSCEMIVMYKTLKPN